MPERIEFEQKFEEAPGYYSGAMGAGMFNGTATIFVCENGEWLVQSITLDCDNGKCSKEAVGESIELDRVQDARLFQGICKSLQRDYADIIDDKVSAALGDHGVPIVPMNAEHRLTKAELV